jgi:hypothetical protein
MGSRLQGKSDSSRRMQGFCFAATIVVPMLQKKPCGLVLEAISSSLTPEAICCPL